MDKTEVREGVKVYEVGYLIVPTVPEEKVPAEVETLKELITKNGGEFIAEEFPKLRTLAYMMPKQIDGVRHKFTQGHFGWVKFDIDPSKLNAVKVGLDTNKHVLRYLLITTVRENTFLGQKLAVAKEAAAEVPADAAPAAPAADLSPEEIDRTIDDMVKEA